MRRNEKVITLEEENEEATEIDNEASVSVQSHYFFLSFFFESFSSLLAILRSGYIRDMSFQSCDKDFIQIKSVFSDSVTFC